jgi:16S rRNA (cytidine1402-2'-O)-methyltransferase
MQSNAGARFGTLTIVATPIGNPKDITLRAIEVLQSADIVLCEDLKPARRLLHELKIDKDLLPLNEHTTKQATEEAIELLLEGKNLALISDAGTPLVADPGNQLVMKAVRSGIRVTTAPGASSVMSALVLSGLPLDSFYFAGFLPREKSERARRAKELAGLRDTIVLLEAPYRLGQLLEDLGAAFGPGREAALAIELTTSKERVVRGTLLDLREQFERAPFKGEYVVVLRGASRSSSGTSRDRRR